MLDTPPLPTDPADAQRWTYTGVVHRMLYGEWRPDLYAKVRTMLSKVRTEAIGDVDISSNVASSVANSTAVLYDDTPIVRNAVQDASLLIGEEGLLVTSGLWALMARVQRDTIGMREMLLRIEVVSSQGAEPELSYTPVFPDRVVAKPDPLRRDRPIRIEQTIRRTDPLTGRDEWTRDIYDISNPNAPYYRIVASVGDVDVTEKYLTRAGVDYAGPFVGEDYPYRYADGSAFIPYVLIHAQKTGQLWDAYTDRELIEGTLTAAAYYTLFGHVMTGASWAQRWMLGATPLGAVHTDENGDGTGRTRVDADPSTVLALGRTDDFDGQPSVGQWSPPVDPGDFLDAAAAYERKVAATASGVNPSDFARMEGDPRSGYALQLSNGGKRAAQQRLEPQFRPSDLETIAKSAALLNRQHSLGLPEDGYSIEYSGVPLSPDEQKALREELTALIAAGLTDVVSAYQAVHPGISREDAKAALDAIRATNAQFA